MVKLTGQSPEAVRGWDWEDVVHLLAHCALEAEEARVTRTQGAGLRAGGAQETTTIFRKRQR